MNADRRDDEHPLEPLARADVGELDPISRDRIESGLRVAHATRPTAASGAPRSTRRWLVAAPALVVLLLVATVALLARDTAPAVALEVRDAMDVVVTLPDGSTVRDPADGFALIDGAVVMVADGGSVTIDDVTLRGGTTVTVRDGRLVTDVVATTTTDRPADGARPDDGSGTDEPAPPTTRPPVDEPPATTAAPIDPPRDDPPTPTTTAPPVDRPPVDDPPGEGGDDPPPRDGDPPDDGGGDDGIKPDDGVDVAVALRVRAGDGAVRVAWSAEGIGDQPWETVVVRTTRGPAADDPGDGVIVGAGAHGELVERRADLPDEIGELTYRVFVLDEVGGVVAASAPQTFHPPGT